MRKRLFEIIDLAEDGDVVSKIYDSFMVAVITLSIVPLCFKTQTTLFKIIDVATAAIFIIDYIARFLTADFLLQKKYSFVRYPLTPMAILDLFTILPTFFNISKVLKIFKTLRLIRILRVFKFIRYSKNIQIIRQVLASKKDALSTVGFLASAYVFISAIVIFQVEPDTFDTLFDAIYWATISLTTVGYGDIYPVSDVGRVIGMLSSFLGIAVVALPSGIIIAGYQEIINKEK